MCIRESSGSYTLSASSSAEFLGPRGKEFGGDIPFGLSVPRSLTLCIISTVVSVFVPICYMRKRADDGWAKLWSMGIAECHEESFYCYLKKKKNRSILFISRFLDCLVSGSWSPRQYWVWAPSCDVGLKSKSILVGFSYKTCATIALALLVHRPPF